MNYKIKIAIWCSLPLFFWLLISLVSYILYILLINPISFTKIIFNYKIILVNLLFALILIGFIISTHIFKKIKIKELKYQSKTKDYLVEPQLITNVNYLLKFSKLAYFHSLNNGFGVNHHLDKNNDLKYNCLDQHHLLVIGTSGIGKTQSIVIPNIIANLFSGEKANLIISDPKGELYEKLLPFILLTSYKVIQLDFINFKGSYWNPLDHLITLWNQKKLDHFEIYLDNLINIIINDIKSNSDPIWHNASKIFIKSHIISLLITQSVPRLDPKLLITTFSQGYKFLIKGYKQLLSTIIEDIDKINIFKKSISLFLDDSNKMLPSIYLMSLTVLQKWSSHQFLKMSSKNEVLLEKILIQPHIIFIKTNPSLSTYWPLATIFINLLINYLMEHKTKLKTLFILDEFANIPAIPNFSNIISTSRGYNIFFMLILQSYSQIKENYKDVNTILGNINYILYLHSNDLETLNMFSSQLGQLKSWQPNNINFNNLKQISYQNTKKQLINNYQLSMLPIGYSILKVAHYQPMILKLDYFYNWSNKIKKIDL